jgi:hypothetical protein
VVVDEAEEAVSYRRGGALLTPMQADLDMGWTVEKQKKYWDAKARACQQMADEGDCLAQVAQHVPVTIGGMGDTGTDIATALNVTAGLFRDPDGTLRRYGPPIVRAADTHVVTPLMQRFGAATAPYLVKYILPPLAILYVLTGISAYYSYRSARKLAANPSRRRKRRRKRRTSRRRRGGKR